MTDRRLAFLKLCLEQMGLPYLWDGKGIKGEPYHGFDCSGFVTWCLSRAGGPDLRLETNANKMWTDWAPVDEPQAGDVALYGQAGSATHVMVRLGLGDMVVGSAGGDHRTTTLQEALASGAKVQVWRNTEQPALNFLGFRQLPWVDETQPNVPPQGEADV